MTSANVVGYEVKTARENFNYYTPMFRPISGGTEMSINEIQMDASVGNFGAQMQFLNANGGTSRDTSGNAVIYVWIPNTEANRTKYPQLTFPEGSNGAWGIQYKPNAWSAATYRNPDPAKGELATFAVGQSVQVKATEGNEVNFSGQVGEETVAVMTRTARENFNYFGNPFPCQMSINNIQMDASVGNFGAQMQFLNANGGTSRDTSGNAVIYVWIPNTEANRTKYPQLTFPEGSNGAWGIQYKPNAWSAATYRDPDPAKGELSMLDSGAGVQLKCTEGQTFYALCPYEL